MKPLDPRLLRYSRSSRGFLFLQAILALVNAVLVVGQSFEIATLACAIFQRHRSWGNLTSHIYWIAALFISRGLISFATELLAAKSSLRMRNELRSQLLDKVLAGKSRAIFNEGPAVISLLATKGIDALDGYFSRFLPQLIIAAIVPLAVGGAITNADLTSGVIVLVTVPLIPIFGILIGRFTGAATEKRWQTLSHLSGYFLDLLTGLPTLKVFGRSKKQGDRLQHVGDTYQEQTMKVLRISFLSSLALEIIATLSVALIAVSIGLRLVGGSLSLKTGLFVLICAPEVYWPIRQVASYFHAAADGVEAATRIFGIIEEQELNGVIKIQDISEISWQPLTVAYPGRAIVEIPAGKIQRGTVNCIIGPSGAGKSTLLALLLGFHSNYSGEISILGSDGKYQLSEVEITSWRQHFSWLPQEVNFPSASVAEVLRNADPQASDADLVKTLSRVGLAPSDLPRGLDTQLGTVQETLSTGQKRKIALARALLKPAQILILDEPSASVDDVSEEVIASAIAEEVEKGKIVVLISHRTNLLADNVVIDFGVKP